MPSRITVIHLSDAEKETLNAAGAAAAAKDVATEIAATLKEGDAALRGMAQAREITPETVGAAEQAVAAKERLLAALPEGEARNRLVAEVQRAKHIIGEARQMLG